MATKPSSVQPKSGPKEPAKGNPWKVDVLVVLDPASRTFRFETDDLPLGPDNELTFHNRGYPGFIITFRLKEPRHGYLFPENLDEALFSVDRPECPTSHGQWRQFKAKAVTENGKNLVVRNQNKDKIRFGFTLRVTNDRGATFWNLDPIAGNENGNWDLA
ncbi:MAG TPA: hypothetical protein VM308_06515 [Sphingomicrobium sp.]|nr:hypothetical protein [Sphingomicrobium sp.]